MGQVSFGTVLREARERKGYDVQSAARRLRIRPDISAPSRTMIFPACLRAAIRATW